MTRGTTLLNEDGTASMATLLLLSHHAFRRDLAHFTLALAKLDVMDAARAAALRTEWQSYREALHGHHVMEDSNIFPNVRAGRPELGAVIDELGAEHRHIDPLLERGSHAFAEPLDVAATKRVISELTGLLTEHLEREEASIVPSLRAAKAFPPPPDEASLELFANGFAWSMHGIAEDVLEQVEKLLPVPLTARLPAARAAFNQRCVRAWGTAEAGRSRSSVPAV
jgi:hypothetical protein